MDNILMVKEILKSGFYMDFLKLNDVIHDEIVYLNEVNYNENELNLIIPIYFRLFEKKEKVFKNIIKTIYSVPVIRYELIIQNCKEVRIDDYANVGIYMFDKVYLKNDKIIMLLQPDLKIKFEFNNINFLLKSYDYIIGYIKYIKINLLPFAKWDINVDKIKSNFGVRS